MFGGTIQQVVLQVFPGDHTPGSGPDPGADTDDGLWHDAAYFTSDDGLWHDAIYFPEDDGLWHDAAYF